MWASATDRHPLTGMIHPAHQCLHRYRAVHQPDAGGGGVAVEGGVREDVPFVSRNSLCCGEIFSVGSYRFRKKMYFRGL